MSPLWTDVNLAYHSRAFSTNCETQAFVLKTQLTLTHFDSVCWLQVYFHVKMNISGLNILDYFSHHNSFSFVEVAKILLQPISSNFTRCRSEKVGEVSPLKLFTSIRKIIRAIQWIEIYPMDSVIHLFNNWGVELKPRYNFTCKGDSLKLTSYEQNYPKWSLLHNFELARFISIIWLHVQLHKLGWLLKKGIMRTSIAIIILTPLPRWQIRADPAPVVTCLRTGNRLVERDFQVGMSWRWL